MGMETLAFDMDGTLVGYWPAPDRNGGFRVKLRPGTEDWIQEGRSEADRVILWTLANRNWYEHCARKFPILREFDEVWTCDDIENHVAFNNGKRVEVKDVRMLGVDLLIDNDPCHLKWAEGEGLEGHYLIVSTYGE